MTGYTQLTQEQRYQIYALRKAEQTQQEIADIVGVHSSTIGRELQRNRGQRGYRPRQAQEMARQRQEERASQTRIETTTWTMVDELLRRDWSPEQVSGHLKKEGQDVSHEWIYRHIYEDKGAGGTLHQHLRCQKKRRKRYGGGLDRRGQLCHRRCITERPAIVEQRRRVGDWEADTIVGAGRQMALVSLTERKSKFVLLQKVEHATAPAICAAMVELLSSVRNGKGQVAKVHTITSDNGREFAQHQEIAAALKADFFFAHPYSSWERGTNENANGLIRQYFPKKTSFAQITNKQIQEAMHRLNHRPRKTLGYKTPHEVLLNG